MKGTISVTVKDSRNSYKFELKRNITILCGDSGRGKTTLFEMVADYNRYGTGSSVKVSCDKAVIAVDGENWEERIKQTKNSVIIIDEDNQFIRSKTFAEVIKNTDNYYLLITRSYLEQLPFSVTEIYQVVGKKNKKFERIYKDVELMYDSPSNSAFPFIPDVIITEDAKTGFQLFEKVADRYELKCVSAGGKSNIYHALSAFTKDNVLIIADGAAFGPEMEKTVMRQRLFPNKIALYLPESFEWLLLKSGLVINPDSKKLVSPEKYIESREYFSWERYFTDLIVDKSKDIDYKKYPASKRKLPDFYKQEKSQDAVFEIMTKIRFGK